MTRADELATRYEALREQAAEHKKRHEKVSEEARRVKAALTAELGKVAGEVASVDGTIYWVERQPPALRVDEAAITRHADALGPLGLAPGEKVVRTLPTITAIRTATRAIRRAGLDPREFIEEGEPVPVLRSRTIRQEARAG